MDLLPLQLVRLVMLLHQQLASPHMARQAPSHRQTVLVKVSQQQHQLRVDTLHRPQIHHSLLQQSGCRHSLLLDMPVGSKQHEF